MGKIREIVPIGLIGSKELDNKEEGYQSKELDKKEVFKELDNKEVSKE